MESIICAVDESREFPKSGLHPPTTTHAVHIQTLYGVQQGDKKLPRQEILYALCFVVLLPLRAKFLTQPALTASTFP